ncbi:oxygen-insensitive NADPH nitroreductase [Alkalicoccus urumqiensis]|uniref:Oxygen-insensitive NADPH nitroreductase n=1 Tax=Alkalicoccus urumqiensis TaxID=1548213 RepID=A0A2P6MEW6_ALKUR|nr:oxygen-insensitive NADPH nitroreductase [Alkalicoccus urumqiensis]PRO64787.1 oxygen-insensitive NADPH nitroreductase [Alkalicoccus urumqiensis]
MNEIVETMLNHRSVRSFKPDPLPADHIEQLVLAGQAASTSSYLQAYTIIGVTDQALKQSLAQLAGNQAYVAENGHFFLFCADFHRHEIAADIHQTDIQDAVTSAEKLIVGISDASLASQNVALAAESMGYGICYIGGIRNNAEEVAELLNLPDHVLPLFGMCVGTPAVIPDKKPRLPIDAVYAENGYFSPETQTESLQQYDDITSSYYSERTGGVRADTWSLQVSGMLSTLKRGHMLPFMQKKGWNRH